MKDVLILVLCEGVLCGDGQPGSSELVAGTSGEVSPSLHARSSIHVKTMAEGEDYCQRKIALLKSNYDKLQENE
ncbi:hypothetical protein ACS0TY_004705 [Phlomoides rotata]